jgi:hypothetical protein
VELPPRLTEAEDAFVRGFVDHPDEASLTEAIGAAIGARRPMLAARLVGLLDLPADLPPDSPLGRARAAAAMILRTRADAPSPNWSALEEAWNEARRDWIDRMKRRMRASVAGGHATRERSWEKPRRR